MELLLKEGQKINIVVKIIPLVFLALIIIYGTFFDFKIESTSDLVEILKSIDTWVGLYIVVLVFPSLITSIKIIRTLPKAEPTRKRMVHILLFSISIIVLIINFVVETFIEAQPNAFSFIAWIFALTALIEAYLGLYKK